MKAVWILELIIKCIILLVEAIMLVVFSPFILLYAWLRAVLFRSIFVKDASKAGIDKKDAKDLSEELKLKKILSFR